MVLYLSAVSDELATFGSTRQDPIITVLLKFGPTTKKYYFIPSRKDQSKHSFGSFEQIVQVEAKNLNCWKTFGFFDSVEAVDDF